MLGHVGRQVAAELGLPEPSAAAAAPWIARLPVGELAVDSVAVASLAIDLVGAARGLGPAGAVRVDPARTAASFGVERIARIDGVPPDVWAPLSGFWRTADGWVRTHANYPHHESALRSLLGSSSADNPQVFAERVAGRSRFALESRASSVGAVVAAVRSPELWRQHPQARAVGEQPLVEVTRRGPGAARAWRSGTLPFSGVRVLDLTRVLAGPVAARDLALAGAEVLRVDTPRLPETPWVHLETAQGKRSTLLDLAQPAQRVVFERLLRGADVVLTGYRPGALEPFGLEPSQLAESHPGLVTASVSAWGWSGPWAGRRGFDSIVQAATGIASIESADGEVPGALPVQALDHSTGHFLVAAIAAGLREQRESGGSIDVRMSLARVAHALLDAPRDQGAPRWEGTLPIRDRRIGGSGPVLTSAPPVLTFRGAPEDYPREGGEWGADAPEWQVRRASSVGA